MSALDLFASAMGAFILIAVIALPYYKKEVPDLRQELAALKTELYQKEQTIAQQAAQISELKKSPKHQLPPLDVVIVLDTTGSMSEEIAALKQELGNLAEVLEKLAPSVAIGIIGFNDKGINPARYTYFRLQKISASDSSLKTLQSALVLITAGGGDGNNDTDGENLGGGFELALKSPWRTESEIQTIVVVTDDVPHPGTENAILSGARRFSAIDKRSVTTVNTSDGDGDEVKRFLRQLKDAGKGRYTETQSSLVAPILLGVFAAP